MIKHFVLRRGQEVLTVAPSEVHGRLRRSVLLFKKLKDAEIVRAHALRKASATLGTSWARSGGVYIMHKPRKANDRNCFNIHSIDAIDGLLAYGHTHMDLFWVTDLAIPSSKMTCELLLCGYSEDAVRLEDQTLSYQRMVMQHVFEEDRMVQLTAPMTDGEEDDNEDGYDDEDDFELVAQ